MQRGQKALMGIVSNDLKVSEKHIKGLFTEERDKALACRFFYYGHLTGLRYDLCLSNLSKEFYLSELVIGQRLMSQQEYLKQLRLNNTTSKDLSVLYPFFNWR